MLELLCKRFPTYSVVQSENGECYVVYLQNRSCVVFATSQSCSDVKQRKKAKCQVAAAGEFLLLTFQIKP